MAGREPRILTVDEARPKVSGRSPAPIIAFASPRHGAVNREALAAALARCGFARQVDTVVIEADSTLTSPWVVGYFPNARFVSLAGGQLDDLDGLQHLRKLTRLSIDTATARRSLSLLPSLPVTDLDVRITRPDDHAAIGGCATLTDLHAVGWREVDLTSLSGVAARHVQLERGAFTSLRGLNTSRLRHLMLQRCSKLTDAGGVAVRSLTVEACNALDLTSLARVDGLSSLILRDQKQVQSLAFVRGCPSLATLVLGFPRRRGWILARSRTRRRCGSSGLPQGAETS